MNRKNSALFIITGLLTGLLLAFAPSPASAQAKKKETRQQTATPAAPPVVPGISRIALFQDLGSEKHIRSPLALARDKTSGDLVISSFDAGEVVILDANGVLVTTLRPETGLVTPYGVAVDDKGLIYVSEIKTGFLKILSPGGTVEDEIDLSEVMGKTVAPGRITLGKDNLIFIADLNNHEILVINTKGEFVRSIGGFTFLQKAAETNDGRIIALSAQGKAVKVFSREGALLQSFGDHGDPSGASVSFPSGFAVDDKGRLWIADAFQHRLKVFSMDGMFLFNYGRMQEKTGGFFFPVDLCFGKNGELYVLEKGGNRIQVFQVDDLKEKGKGASGERKTAVGKTEDSSAAVSKKSPEKR